MQSLVCQNSHFVQYPFRYIGETGRKFGTRLKEHKTEVESITSKPFTRNQRASSLSQQNKSALTDHATHDNHVTNWPAATILDRESDKSTRWIKEAVHIRKEGWQSLNRDDGSYTLSHMYDRFLDMSHHYRGKNQKKNWTSFFWWRSLIDTKTSKSKNVGCVEVMVSFVTINQPNNMFHRQTLT